MKCFKYICVSFLVLCMTIAAGSRTVQAAEEEYTYTIRLYAGNQGILTGTVRHRRISHPAETVL